MEYKIKKKVEELEVVDGEVTITITEADLKDIEAQQEYAFFSEDVKEYLNANPDKKEKILATGTTLEDLLTKIENTYFWCLDQGFDGVESAVESVEDFIDELEA